MQNTRPEPGTIFGVETAIAVLPPTETPASKDGFGEKLALEVTSNLQQIGVSTTDLEAVSALVVQGADAPRIARRFGVDYVISINVRSRGDKVRVTAELLDYSGALIWTKHFNAIGDDLDAMHKSFAAKITAQAAAEIPDLAASVAPAAPAEPKGRPDYAKSTKERARERTRTRGHHPYNPREEYVEEEASDKSRFIALLLLFPIFGIFGIHRFYGGRPLIGLLFLFTGGLAGIGWMVDIVMTVFGRIRDGEGKRISRWSGRGRRYYRRLHREAYRSY